jgi:hypothetical protein
VIEQRELSEFEIEEQQRVMRKKPPPHGQS